MLRYDPYRNMEEGSTHASDDARDETQNRDWPKTGPHTKWTIQVGLVRKMKPVSQPKMPFA